MSNKGRVYFTWSVIALILLVAVGYLIFNKSASQSIVSDEQNIVLNSENNLATAIAPVLETNDWKTYTNSQFSFEFKYPKDWYIVGKHTLVNNDAQLLSNYEKEEDNNLPNLKDDAENIFFKTYIVAKNTTLDDLKPKTNVISFEKFITSAGLEGRKVVIYSEDHPVGNHTYYIFLQNNRVIHFSLGSMSEDQIILLEKILGGFKFTADAVSDWKTYTNTEYGFEMKYPSESKVGKFEGNGIRIENLPGYQLEKYSDTQYFMEFSMIEPDQSGNTLMKEPKKFMIGTTTAYRGPALDGPRLQYAFTMCALKDGKNFMISVHEGSANGKIAYGIMDSFRFISSATAEWLRFYNNAGDYSFKYPPVWNAAMKKANTKESLFGVNANSDMGTGGVEIRDFSGSLNAYMDDLEKKAEIKYLTRDNVTINGVKGIRAEYKGFPVSGFAVLLKNGNQVYTIFINSKKAADIALFDRLTTSFRFE